MKCLKPLCLLLVAALCSMLLYSQADSRIAPEQCATMQTLDIKLQANPALRKKFEAERTRFNNAIRQGIARLNGLANGNRTILTVPVVFHIVLTNPAIVTDAQLQAQLDTLNKDYAGANGDSVKIPSYFKPLFGKSGIQFCLARQTPAGEPTNGIERISTSKTSFQNTDDGVKHVATGGADAWDPSSYFNVWICPLANGILGYGTFPGGSNDNEQGVVVDYRALPGGAYPTYNGGKTLTHETGHYFNLYHIWGDDSGTCSGTDFVDDTPNQGNSNTVCPTGIRTDNCTTSGNGIMYQNYMDYTYDECLVMFTTQQVDRMEAALTAFRPSLLVSSGCQPPVLYNYDAQLRSINQPGQRICSNNLLPSITIRNRGTQTLTSLVVTTVIDNGNPVTYNWTGNLAALATTDITVAAVNVGAGNHVLKVTLSNPNNNADQNTINDTLSIAFQYYPPVSSVTESFEGNVFPPPGWDIVNADNGITWQKANGVAKTGNSSVSINNFNYTVTGQQDYLRLPNVNLPAGLDSAFFSFQVSAATYTAVNTPNNVWDTLEVLASTDCGKTYTSLYKKWGSTLVTRTDAITSSFVPTAAEWRKDSINISNYIGAGNLLLAFRNTTGTENNVYLDDINLRSVSVNPNLKSRGLLVTPSPTRGPVIVQFYPQPTDVKSIAIFSMSGQKVAEVLPAGQLNYYSLDISRYAAGAYMVRIVMGNNVMVKKIIKVN
ncbi:MAG TPA: M43 family zinc metalloprotease [Chitinophagaceae bacterium]|nr:M43 family zinc metalloprotease [Chitinophagaceae bacterium]